MSSCPPDERPAAPGGPNAAAARFAERFRRVNQVLFPADLGRPYTEREIADRVDMSVSQVGNLRNGRGLPRADRAVAIAQLFGVRVEYFFLQNDDDYVRTVNGQLEAIERERSGQPQSRGNRGAGSAAAADDAPVDDDEDEVRQIAEGVADLPGDMRRTVGALVAQLRAAVGLQSINNRRRRG